MGSRCSGPIEGPINMDTSEHTDPLRHALLHAVDALREALAIFTDTAPHQKDFADSKAWWCATCEYYCQLERLEHINSELGALVNELCPDTP